MAQKWWSVPYEAKYRGTVQVEAETADEAKAKVDAGDFEDDPGAERVDWSATGQAKEDT